MKEALETAIREVFERSGYWVRTTYIEESVEEKDIMDIVLTLKIRAQKK